MIRHVVTFTWEPTAGEEQVAAAIAALRGLRQEVRGMSFLVVAEDAGLSDGNASAVLIADFADAETFYRYAQDPVHLSVVAEFVRPILAARAAVQYHVRLVGFRLRGPVAAGLRSTAALTGTGWSTRDLRIHRSP